MTKDQYLTTLYQAQQTGKPIDKSVFSTDIKDQTDAYNFVYDLLALKEKDGQNLLGYKIAATSPQMMEKFGVTEPMYAPIMGSKPTNQINLDEANDPAIEPELIFIVNQDILPDDDHETLLKKVEVAPGIEIPDTRYTDRKGLSSLQSLCDWIGAAYIAVGKPQAATYENLDKITGELFLDGVSQGKNTSEAILEHPIKSLAWLVKKLDEHGRILKAGQLVSSGSFLLPADLQKGEYEARYQGFGSVILRVK